MDAIKVRGLRKSYGDNDAVGGIDFSVAVGEVVAMLGPNGAGKTTTVEILEGYLPKQLAGDELVALVEKTIADLGATTKREMGKVMGALTAATGGNFDKAQAAKEVGSRLS